MLICLRVKMGLSCLAEVVDEDGELLGPACPSIMCASNIGSGEEGAEPGEGGPCVKSWRISIQI